MKSLKSLKSFRTITEANRSSSIVFQQFGTSKQLQNLAASIVLKPSNFFKSITQLSNLASFKALSNLENSPFFESSVLALASEIGLTENFDESFIEIDVEVSEEILSATDFNTISNKTKNIILYLQHTYFLPIFLSCLSASYAMTNVIEARKETNTITTAPEARAFVKNPNENFDLAAQKGFV